MAISDMTLRLAKAMGEQRFVRIKRSPRFAHFLDGYVVGIGEQWVLLAEVGEGGYLREGWVAVRLRDITSVRRRDRAIFEDRFARASAEWPPRAPEHPVDLDSTKQLLISMSWNAPLIAIEQERRRSALWIGVLLGHAGSRSGLLEVTPTGRWRRTALGYRRSDMTAVKIKNSYMRALATTAGPPSADAVDHYLDDGAVPPAETRPTRVLRVFFDWGHRWPLWETGHDDLVRSPDDYGLSDATVAAIEAWRTAWMLIADPDRIEKPSRVERESYVRHGRDAIRCIKREVADEITVTAPYFPGT